MGKIIKVTTIDEEFQKARTPGAKDVKKRKRRWVRVYEPGSEKGPYGRQLTPEAFGKIKTSYYSIRLPANPGLSKIYGKKNKKKKRNFI